MEFIKTLLEQQPLMALFLTIAIGYIVGEINIKGFSLGVGAVLFVALAVGFLMAAWRPALASGMRTVVGAAAVLLVVTAAIDLIAGRTGAGDEAPDVLAVAGWLLLCRVAADTSTVEGKPDRRLVDGLWRSADGPETRWSRPVRR